MYEHDWHWKRALLAGFISPLAAVAMGGAFYWATSNLIAMLGSDNLAHNDFVSMVGFFLEIEPVFFISVGTGLAGMVLTVFLGTPIGYGLSKFPRYSKATYVFASFLAFPLLLLILRFQEGGVVVATERDLYFLGYFLLVTLVNGWIAHWIVHGKRKRPPEKIETVFE